jgi:hypothetical protein
MTALHRSRTTCRTSRSRFSYCCTPSSHCAFALSTAMARSTRI